MAIKQQSLPVILVPHPHVRVDQAILGGSPHVNGSKVPVRRIYSFYRDGTKVETIMRRFPQLGPARVLDALAFALDNLEVIEADAARESAILTSVGAKVAKSSRADAQMSLPFDAEHSAESPAEGTDSDAANPSK